MVCDTQYLWVMETQIVMFQYVKRQKQPPELFCKKSIIGNFTKFTGKHLCQSLFFNKAAGLRPPFYRTPLGDCFWSPEKARTGCSYDLQKDECVDHIQKRIGTALREYKRKMKWIRLTDGKSVLGNGRLTDVAKNKI